MIRKLQYSDTLYDVDCAEYDSVYYKLVAMFLEELEHDLKEIMEDPYGEDQILSRADNFVPVYNWEIVETWASDNYLWFMDIEEAYYPEDADTLRRMMIDICWALEQEGRKWYEYNQEILEEEQEKI